MSKNKDEVEIVPAEIGDIVEFDGMLGKVEKINENSVIVDITINEDWNENEDFEKTVVNHKRYTIKK
ncbi:hypothetical protein HMPREF2767_06585 [Nosocomiicoccus sp. HMSC067E10]|nr:hypothetical protein HMPREF2767_06585 [Nosocomiicoccus sp. HMSC067E10]OFO52623.1 hypothetical protein HMPREF3029_02340 [Nosocomiicoccus sp. HMSC059G07]